QVPDARADAAPGRVDAGDQQQAQRAQDVLGRHRLAVDFRMHEIADQVVGRLLCAIVHGTHEVVGHFAGGPYGRAHIGDADLQDLVDPAAVEVAVALGQPQHVGDDAHRDLLGVFDGRIAAAA